MKSKNFIQSTVVLISALTVMAALRAADKPDGPPSGQPNRDEIRERLKNLPPEERPQRLKEMREKRGPLPDGPLRDEMQKFREEIRNLPPEEREARIKEFREKHPNLPAGFGSFNRPNGEELMKFRESIKDLPPAEREARMKEWREERIGERPLLRDMPSEERQAKRQEIKGRMEKRLEEMRKKKADGTITEQESKQLLRMEDMMKRFDQGGPGFGFGEGRPGAPGGDKPPVRRPPAQP